MARNKRRSKELSPKTKKAVAKRKRTLRRKKRQTILRRSVFYAVSLFVVFQVMLIPLQGYMYIAYWMLATIGFGVVLTELLYSRYSARRIPIQVDMKHVGDTRWREHFLHHALLPGILYISGVMFMFFNRVRPLDQAAVVLLSGSFGLIFYNISATYMKMHKISRNTKMIFDFINIIVFYFFTDVLINLVLYEGWPHYVVFIASGAITVILLGMMISLAKQISRQILLALVLSVILVGVGVMVIWHIPIFNTAVISLVATVMFYLVVSYWHHRLEGTLTWDVMSQYGLFALMALILLLYI